MHIVVVTLAVLVISAGVVQAKAPQSGCMAPVGSVFRTSAPGVAAAAAPGLPARCAEYLGTVIVPHPSLPRRT